MFDKGSGVLPIAETIHIVQRISAHHGDKGITEEPEHKQDLEDGQVKLGDAEIAYSNDVE